jgi:tRNA G46 methylase TrmB
MNTISSPGIGWIESTEKPYTESCDENKAPILAVLQRLCCDIRSVLEIGSGSAQHGIHFAAATPQLIWQTSDVEMPVNGRMLVWRKESSAAKPTG